MKTIKVENMTNNNYRLIPNQFIILNPEGVYFQSYKSIIAFKPVKGKIQLDKFKWDYSVTTGRYRNIFLGEKKKETVKKINNGEYELIDLN
ncbi:MAG: hypothetical protein WC549_01940 [Actinomycetota bacterium]